MARWVTRRSVTWRGRSIAIERRPLAWGRRSVAYIKISLSWWRWALAWRRRSVTQRYGRSVAKAWRRCFTLGRRTIARVIRWRWRELAAVWQRRSAGIVCCRRGRVPWRSRRVLGVSVGVVIGRLSGRGWWGGASGRCWRVRGWDRRVLQIGRISIERRRWSLAWITRWDWRASGRCRWHRTTSWCRWRWSAVVGRRRRIRSRSGMRSRSRSWTRSRRWQTTASWTGVAARLGVVAIIASVARVVRVPSVFFVAVVVVPATVSVLESTSTRGPTASLTSVKIVVSVAAAAFVTVISVLIPSSATAHFMRTSSAREESFSTAKCNVSAKLNTN